MPAAAPDAGADRVRRRIDNRGELEPSRARARLARSTLRAHRVSLLGRRVPRVCSVILPALWDAGSAGFCPRHSRPQAVLLSLQPHVSVRLGPQALIAHRRQPPPQRRDGRRYLSVVTTHTRCCRWAWRRPDLSSPPTRARRRYWTIDRRRRSLRPSSNRHTCAGASRRGAARSNVASCSAAVDSSSLPAWRRPQRRGALACGAWSVRGDGILADTVHYGVVEKNGCGARATSFRYRITCNRQARAVRCRPTAACDAQAPR